MCFVPNVLRRIGNRAILGADIDFQKKNYTGRRKIYEAAGES